MKQIVWAFIAVLALAGSTGCHSLNHFFLHGNKGCSQCGDQGCPACGKGKFAHHKGHHLQNGDPHYYGGGGGACPHCGPGDGSEGYAGPGAGPGQVTYPYYTTRGPRDFLVDNPPSIGPQ